MKKYQFEYDLFQKFVSNKNFSLLDYIIAFLKIPKDMIEFIIRYIPGPIGFKLRYFYYKIVLKKIGKNVLIDVGVHLHGTKNISIGEYTWIDSYTIINAFLGEVIIGKRIHIAPFVIIGARERIIIEDYVGISSGVKIYSNSEKPIDKKRMSGPMVPEDQKAFYSAPVVLKKESFVGANSIILPGVTVEEGAVIGANSVISKNIESYDIVMGIGRKIGVRERVDCKDI